MARQSVTKYTKSGMTVYGTLEVTGALTAGGGLSYTNLTLSGNLVVQGDTHLGNAAGDAVHVIGTAEFDENATFDKDVTVTGDVSCDDLTVGDDVGVGGDLTLSAGNIDVTGSITASVTIQGADLVSTDDVTVGDDLVVTSDASVGNDLAVTRDVTVGRNLAVTGNVGVTGTLSCATFAPATINVTTLNVGGVTTCTGALVASASITVGTTLQVTGATTLDGHVDLGNAAADDITVNGSVDSDINFKTGAARQILGPASNDLTIQAPAGRALVLQSNAGTVLSLSAAGAINPAANIQFTLAGACSITGTADQNMSILAAGTGNAYLGSAGSATAIAVLAAGTVTITPAATFSGAIQPQTDITFGGALAHAITGVAGQALTIGALTTGVLTIETATGDLVLQSDNAAAALTISGASDLITLGSPLTTTETIAKTGTANGGAVTIKVAEGLHNVVGGGLTETIAAAIPAGALVLTVLFRVTTIIASAGGASWDAGVGGAATRYAENLAFAAGTTSTMADHVAASSPIFYKVATDIVLTLDAGTWTSGAIRWKVFYIDSTAIAS